MCGYVKVGKKLMLYTHSNEYKGLEEKMHLRFQEMAVASGPLPYFF